jgi:hypothetical protein
MDGTRRHDEIGDERPHFTRRGPDDLSILSDPEGAEQTHRYVAAHIVWMVRRSSVPDKFLAHSHARFQATLPC